MKKIVFFVFVFLFAFGYSQTVTDIEEISPFHEGLAAIKKNNQWGFIDSNGKLVIDFRNDLVSNGGENIKDKIGINAITYPFFQEGKCIIKKEIEGINFYGFMDTTGKEIIAPQFLNTTNFSDGYALVIRFEKNIVGKNMLLDKDIISYQLEQYIVDDKGKIVKYLESSRNCNPKDLSTKCVPEFESKLIAPHLAAVKDSNGTWSIVTY